MDKTITADEEKLLKRVREFRLAFDERTDTIMAYIAEPYRFASSQELALQ